MWKLCLQTFGNNRIRQKLAYFLRHLETSWVNNSRILWIKKAKFSGYCFNMNTNIWRDFCISVPLREKIDRFWLRWGVLNEYVKQIIIMVVFRKENFHIQWTFADGWKINNVLEDHGEELTQTTFSKQPDAHEVLRRRNVMHILELSFQQRTQHKVDPS